MMLFPDSSSGPARPECPTCGAVDEHGDDFCHECGHSFGWGSSGTADAFSDDVQGVPCPVCPTGEILELSYGVRQCDSCGYTARDGATA